MNQSTFKLSSSSTLKYVYFFIFLHFIAWTLVPALVRYNLPLDAIEGAIWGHQLEWGYDKNPFLNGWLTALAAAISGKSGWLIYGFSQASVIASFWVVWQLGKSMFSPLYGLIAVMLLEGIQYFNLHAIDFNDNTLELGLWALTTYCFYYALCAQKPANRLGLWSLTGFFAALGTMAKYYTLALIATMVLFIFFDKKARIQLKTPAPYIGLILFFIIILPHIIWLFTHDFITIEYVFKRASNTPDWTNHFTFPLQFAWEQFQVFVPALLLFLLCFLARKSFFKREPSINTELQTFNKKFLLAHALGPFLLTIMLGFLFGITLRAGWGMPLLTFWPLALISLIPPHVSRLRIFSFIIATFLLMGTLLLGYSFSLICSDTPSSANFPGRELAQIITQRWQKTYHTPLAYVAGSRWVGGNIAFYSADHPAVFVEWNKQHAPWIKEAALRSKGAVFVWEISNNEQLPNLIKTAYPRLEKISVVELDWKRNRYNLAPIKVGVAFLPPGGA